MYVARIVFLDSEIFQLSVFCRSVQTCMYFGQNIKLFILLIIILKVSTGLKCNKVAFGPASISHHTDTRLCLQPP